MPFWWLMLPASVIEPRSMTMHDQVSAAPRPKPVPWNKGKLTGAKPHGRLLRSTLSGASEIDADRDVTARQFGNSCVRV
jgi:hypothetical protein